MVSVRRNTRKGVQDDQVLEEVEIDKDLSS